MRPRLGSIARVACLFLLCASGATSGEAVASGPPPAQWAEIAVVGTLDELLSRPALKVPVREDETSVRLGIEALKAEAGSGILIYAISSTTELLDDTLDDLGPVIVKVKREGGMEEAQAMVNKAQMQMVKAPLYFFAKSIPLPVAGRYHVQVLESKKKHPIASATIDVAEPQDDEPRWRRFDPKEDHALEAPDVPLAGDFSIGPPAIPKVEGDDPLPLFTATADGKMEGAERITLPTLLPTRIPKESPRARPADLDRQIRELIGRLSEERYEVRDSATRELASLGREAETFLEQARREGTDPEVRVRAAHVLRMLAGPFAARLENGAIRCDFVAPVSPTLFGEHLLARWWVNGRPAKIPMKEQRDQLRKLDQLAESSHRVDFAVDVKLLGVNPADTIEVEFLYCPTEIQEIGEEIMMKMQDLERAEELQYGNGDAFHKVRPIRSNRLKFTASALRASNL